MDGNGKLLLAVVAACALLMAAGWYFTFVYVSPWGHFAIELFTAAVGTAVVYLSFKTFMKLGSTNALLAGTAFLLMGVLDLLHALAYTGMPQTLLPTGTNITLQFWVASRVLGGLLLLGSVALGAGGVGAKRRPALAAASLVGVLAVAVALSAWVTLSPGSLPTYYADGALTPLKIGLEAVAAASYLLAAALFFQNYRKTRSQFAYWLALGLVVMVFSEAAFMLYRNVWGPYIWLGHSMKLVAFGAFLYGLYRTVRD